MLNTMIMNDLGRKIYLACTFVSQLITEGSQGKKSMQESGVGAESETMKGCSYWLSLSILAWSPFLYKPTSLRPA